MKIKKIKVCKEYKKGKYDNICINCNSNKSYCDYTRTLLENYGSELVSNCCGAKVDNSEVICLQCFEGCEPIQEKTQ